MTQAIFRDDAPLDARREAAVARLMGMCPAPLQLVMRPLVENAVAQVGDAELRALLLDLDTVKSSAEAGDMQAITDIARRYGATESQVSSFLPLFQQAS